MNLHLGKTLEDYVREKAKTGGYRSAGEVVREAVRQMRDRETKQRPKRKRNTQSTKP